MIKIIIFIFCLFLIIQNNIVKGLDITKEQKELSNNILYQIEDFSYQEKTNFLYEMNKRLEKIIFFLVKKEESKNKIEKLKNIQKINYENIFKINEEKNNEIIKNFLKEYPEFSEFKHIYTQNEIFFLEDDIWYTFDYKNYYSSPKNQNFSKNFFYKNNFFSDSTIIILDKNNIRFVPKYTKFRLISDEIIFGIPEKRAFLSALKNTISRGNINQNLDNDFKKLKLLSQKIGEKAKNEEEKIQKIYDFVIKVLEYDYDYDFDKIDSFSGIFSLKNRKGVCEGYVKLMLYISQFNGINSQIKTGEILTSEDFGKIGHARIQIGDYFYDPTFEDTQKSQNKYFRIPKDLFYADRYNYEEVPESIKNLNLDERKILARENLLKIYSKYAFDNYDLLNEIDFRLKNNINIKEDFEINDIKKASKSVYTSEDLKTINFNGEKKIIQKIKYYKIEDKKENINNILEQFQYNLDDFIFIEVKEKDKKYYVISKDYNLI